ncbi:MAG: hypothetical protein ACFB00_07850 [Parvularculaceae bacterium]
MSLFDCSSIARFSMARSAALAALAAFAMAACQTTGAGVAGEPGSGALSDTVSGRRDAAPFLRGTSVVPVSTPGGGTPDEAFNIVFLADSDAYNGLATDADFSRFVADVNDVAENGFRQVEGLRVNETLLHFYALKVPGRVTTAPCPSNLEFPEDVIERDSLFADAFIILHDHETSEVRDCADTNTRYASAGKGRGPDGVLRRKLGVAVHEAMHAVFLLPDEYSGGGMWATEPPVVFENPGECADYRAAVLGMTGGCAPIMSFRGERWHKADDRPFGREIMDPKRNPFLDPEPFGPSDWIRAREVMRRISPDVAEPALPGGPTS